MFGFTSVSSSNSKEDADLVDLEEGRLYPGIGAGENQLRWGFIRKVYGILATQIVLTTVVSAVTILYHPLNEVLLLWPLYIYQQKHPLNLVFLGLFTACLSVTVGVTCANTDGQIVLEALVLTSAVVSSLTVYTFWASRKGKDFSFLGPILFSSLVILVVVGFMQMFFPFGPAINAIYGGIGAIIFSGYIVYDTENLIKRFTYDEYIWASVHLYLDILNLFLTILRMLNQRDDRGSDIVHCSTDGLERLLSDGGADIERSRQVLDGSACGFTD
ncbi:Bax inhibitor 1-related [Dillenia turbinata]|uniref:Bax inhibitor 1-related n=1 Tax=Dillenia turbinata TaxID=194707 RepID=A0AAN8ZDT0_9MAGN